MNKETVKAKAKALQSFLVGQGVLLKHSAALEAIARVEGFPSYNVLQSQWDTTSAPGNPPGERMMVSWDVEVCRVGYAHATVTVRCARTSAEAARRALDEVCDDNFSSEKSSDYFISGNEPTPDWSLETDDEQPGPYRDWEVTICQMSYGTQTLNIPGHGLTQAAAEELALDHAGNLYFSMDNSERVVTGVQPYTDFRKN